MFTGIIRDLGRVVGRDERGGDVELTIEPTALAAAETRVGDSIAVSGVCLTVTKVAERAFAADVSRETLALTTLGGLAVGSRVNLEPSLRLGDALGGHLVSGHVDGVARLIERQADARSERFRFEMPGALARFVAVKGSICVDGISLTVNAADASTFAVNIIPHTLQVTTLGSLRPGAPVNVEVDLLARYVARLADQ